MKVSSTVILPRRCSGLEGRYSFIRVFDSKGRVSFPCKQCDGWVIARLIFVQIFLELPQAVEACVAPKEARDEADVGSSAPWMSAT